MSGFDLVGADALDPARLHAAFTAAFADYLIGPFRLPLAQWPQFLARQGVALHASRVALRGGEPVAFCLAAPRPEDDSWRLGTMGALPAARGSGAAPALLDDFLARAQAAGAGTAELECFAQNTRALRLYQGRGFRIFDTLYGHRRAPDGPTFEPTDDAMDTSLREAFDWLDASRAAGCPLPLQVTPRSLRTLPVELPAWRRGDARLLFSIGAEDRIDVHALVDRAPAQDDARALVSELLARHPRRAVHVPQLQRPAIGGTALDSLGFERLPLHQLWLQRPLA
jgi:ribosomal protein S18 acetylase RimI-like enzyme